MDYVELREERRESSAGRVVALDQPGNSEFSNERLFLKPASGKRVVCPAERCFLERTLFLRFDRESDFFRAVFG